MDARAAHDALRDLIRVEVGRSVDQLAAELRAELRRGKAPPPMSPMERRAEAQALRARGLSVPKIAQHLGCGKSTAARDVAGISTPRETRGPYRRPSRS